MMIDENNHTVLVPHISLNEIWKERSAGHDKENTPNSYNQFDQLPNLHPQNVCKEVQISYLDNKLDPGSAMPGDVANASEASSSLLASEQFSLISGDSKENIKENIQCEVEKLMSKFCSKQELEDIQNENSHPNIINRSSVIKRQNQEIAVFAEKLIENINVHLSEKINKNPSDRSIRMRTAIFERKNSTNADSMMFSNQHAMKNNTFDKKNLSKFMLKDTVESLSPISKEKSSKENWEGVRHLQILLKSHNKF